MRRVLRWLDRYFEEVFAGTALTAMALLVFAQVVMRYVFHKASSWTDEVAIYCLVWFVYISASWAVRERAHIRVTNLMDLMPPRLAQWFIYLSDAIWLAFAAFLTWQGILLDKSLWVQKYTSPVLGIDQKWPYMVVAVGFALMIFRMLQLYWRHFKYGESLTEPPSLQEGRPIHE